MFSRHEWEEPQGSVLSHLDWSQVLNFFICKMGSGTGNSKAPKAFESMKGKLSGVSL